MADAGRSVTSPASTSTSIVPTARGLPFRRSYSIASAPDAAHPDVFEVAVTRVEGGPTSEALHALPPGGVVEIEGVRGTFVRTDDDRSRPSLFVAAGTGLAPIRAMLRRGGEAAGGAARSCCSSAAARPPTCSGETSFAGWERACARFRLHVTLSRPPPEWAGLTGYVQRHAGALGRALPGPQAYVCGLSAMVDDVVARLGRDERLAREPRSATRPTTEATRTTRAWVRAARREIPASAR